MAHDFSVRSGRKELLDLPHIPFADIRRNMSELEVINSTLGGHAISIRGFRMLAGNRKKIRITEIGCGGGDNLKALMRYSRRLGIEASVTGIDSNAECIRAAREGWKEGDARWIHADYRKAELEEQPDILFSSLFCHHFTDEELVDMLHWMDAHSGLGWFINDLHRHPMAYHSIRLLTRCFSRSYLVKHDAPLSVLRGFQRQEWLRLLGQAGLEDYMLRWQWAFRWLLVRKKQEGTTDQYV